MRPPPGPVPEHGQALRPRGAARAAAARPQYPATLVEPATTCASAAPGTPRCGSSGCCGRSGSSTTRQLEPARRTSPRAAPRPTGRTCHPSARPVPARRPAPRDTGPHTGRARLGYDRARVLTKKRTGTASGRGLDLHQLRHSAATHLRDQKSPPADHGQDPAQVPAHRHARRRSCGRGHQRARPAKADSLTRESYPARRAGPGPLPGWRVVRCAPRSTPPVEG